MATQTIHAQGPLTRGIYEFEDPSGTLLGARFPQTGSADLYSGTAVIVRPNQQALLVYQGKIAELLGPGTHSIATENFPVLTKLANWKFGFTSPLRCEIWFFSTGMFTSRRWGTAQPVLYPLGSLGTIPLRAFGNYSITVKDPRALYLKLLGSRASYDVTDVEEYIQGQIAECMPKALEPIKDVKDLSPRQAEVGKRLLALLFSRLSPIGIEIHDVQVMSILPPQEVLQALDEKLAMQVIGNPRDYLLYKAANSLDALHGHGGDPMQVMMGLMLGRGLVSGTDQKEAGALAPTPINCANCKTPNPASSKFCSQCGKELH